jgi:hypothetical protein
MNICEEEIYADYGRRVTPVSTGRFKRVDTTSWDNNK